jgi:hypothetical protein
VKTINKKAIKEIQKAIKLKDGYQESERKEGSVFLEGGLFFVVKEGRELPCNSLSEAYEKAK